KMIRSRLPQFGHGALLCSGVSDSPHFAQLMPVMGIPLGQEPSIGKIGHGDELSCYHNTALHDSSPTHDHGSTQQCTPQVFRRLFQSPAANAVRSAVSDARAIQNSRAYPAVQPPSTVRIWPFM